MTTTTALRSTFRQAFARYSRENATLRTLETKLPFQPTCDLIIGINAQQRACATAESDYRAIRLEYINRLLSSLC